MKNQYRSKVTMAWTVSLLATGLQAGTAVNPVPVDTPKLDQSTTQVTSASVQGKAGRLLSGTVAYGTHYWSFAKVDWMEPIWQSQGKQLYTSLDYMNHLNKSNNHSHEIGSGLVWWQPLASQRELGLGAYWLNYNSWHTLRHHALRLGAKLIWQEWQVTGNGFFRLSKEKPGKPGQQLHPYFGDGLLGSERVLNGVDMILDKQVGPLAWQAFAYHYPSHSQQTSQLLSTGLGLALQTLIPPLSTTTLYTHAKLKATYDKHKHQLLLVSLQTSTPISRKYQIDKTDTDANPSTQELTPLSNACAQAALAYNKYRGTTWLSAYMDYWKSLASSTPSSSTSSSSDSTPESKLSKLKLSKLYQARKRANVFYIKMAENCGGYKAYWTKELYDGWYSAK